MPNGLNVPRPQEAALVHHGHPPAPVTHVVAPEVVETIRSRLPLGRVGRGRTACRRDSNHRLRGPEGMIAPHESASDE